MILTNSTKKQTRDRYCSVLEWSFDLHIHCIVHIRGLIRVSELCVYVHPVQNLVRGKIRYFRHFHGGTQNEPNLLKTVWNVNNSGWDSIFPSEANIKITWYVSPRPRWTPPHVAISNNHVFYIKRHVFHTIAQPFITRFMITLPLSVIHVEHTREVHVMCSLSWPTHVSGGSCCRSPPCLLS